MKQLSVIALGAGCALALYAAPAAAQWTKVLDTPSGRSVFIDPGSIEHGVAVRQVAELWNYRAPDSFGDLSAIQLAQYNCDTHQRHLVQRTGYRAAMAQGSATAVQTNPDAAWQPVAPQSAAAAILAVACLN